MNDILEYLRKFRPDIDMIPFNSEDALQKEQIPEQWMSILGAEDITIRKNKLISLWQHTCGREFSRVITHLNTHLTDVFLLLHKGQLLLLYAIRNKDGVVYYYEGGFPQLSARSPYLQARWQQLPAALQRFYETLHNGFYYSSSGNMGLVPLQSLLKLSDKEWPILEELDEDLELNLETSYGFFKNGMGDYLVLDLEKENTGEEAILWYSQEEPEYELPFWEVVDEWTALGIEE